MKKVKAFVKAHWGKILITAALAMVAFGGYRYVHPFKYIKADGFSQEKKNGIVKIMREKSANATDRKAIEDAAKAANKSYREQLEINALAQWTLNNPGKV